MDGSRFETWLAGEKFSNSTLLVVTGCFLVRSKRLHAIITLFPCSTSALGILYEEMQARYIYIDIDIRELNDFRGCDINAKRKEIFLN